MSNTQPSTDLDERARGPSTAAAGETPQPQAIERPGREFPAGVYLTVIGAFAWMLFVAWLAFNSTGGTDLDLLVVTVLTVMFFAIPLAMHHTSVRSTAEVPTSLRQFMGSTFETWTGPMPARQAWMEVALIPVGLAFAATLFAIAYVIVH